MYEVSGLNSQILLNSVQNSEGKNKRFCQYISHSALPIFLSFLLLGTVLLNNGKGKDYLDIYILISILGLIVFRLCMYSVYTSR